MSKQKTVRFLYQWDAIPDKMLVELGRQGAVNCIKSGLVIGEDDEEGSGITFYEGEYLIHGFDPTEDKLVFTEDEGLTGFIIAVDYTVDEDKVLGLKPEISIDDELIKKYDLDFPDSIFTAFEQEENK